MQKWIASLEQFFKRHPRARLGVEVAIAAALFAMAIGAWKLLSPYLPALSFGPFPTLGP